jgi:hypothetical protein
LLIHHTPTVGGWLLAQLLFSVLVPHSAPAHRVWLLAPLLFSEVGSLFHPTTTPVSVVDYNSLSIVFSFVQGRVQSVHELCWIMFHVGRGECVLCGAHMLGLQIYTGNWVGR